MATRLQRRRNTSSNLDSFVGADGETVIDTTKKVYRVHDGLTPGGAPASEVVTLNSIKDLADLPSGFLRTDRQYSAPSFWPGLGTGGGIRVWNPDRPKSEHDGGRFVDPDKILDLGIFGDADPFGSYFTAASGSESGCFDLIRTESYITPYHYGGYPSIMIDSTQPIRASIYSGLSCHLPQGSWIITDTLTILDRRKLFGVNVTWSPNDSLTTNLVWEGDAGKEMVRCAKEPFGTATTSAIAGVDVSRIYLDGKGVAAVGFYGAQCREESVFNFIIARNCQLFGILFEGDHYYVTFNNLLARDNDGIGIAFGYNYNNLFTDNRFNGVDIGYIRAQSCGVKYDAATAPTGFDISLNPRGGCGIYARLKSTSKIGHALSEFNYGPGLTIETFGATRARIGSTYLENNGIDSLADGVSPRKIEVLLYDNNTSNNVVRFTEINNEGGTPGDVYYFDGGGYSEYIFDNCGPLIFSANVTGSIPVRFNGRTYSVNGDIYLSNQDAPVRKSSVFFAELNSVRNSKHEVISLPVKSGFVSGDSIDLFTVSLPTQATGRSTSALIQIDVGVQARDGSNLYVRNKSFMVSLAAGKRFSTVTATESNVTELMNHAANLSSTGFIIDDFSLGVSFDGGDPTAVATISVTPTFSATPTDTEVGATAESSGLGLGGSYATIDASY